MSKLEGTLGVQVEIASARKAGIDHSGFLKLAIFLLLISSCTKDLGRERNSRLVDQALASVAGVHGKVDREAAMPSLKQAQENGSDLAAVWLAILAKQQDFSQQYQVPKGFSDTYERVKKLADDDDPAALLAVAAFNGWFLRGTDMPILTPALQAAKAGYGPAYSFVGAELALQDQPAYDEAEVWLSKGAEWGDAMAYYQLGFLYGQKAWAKHDYAKAAENFSEAVRRQLPIGFSALGYCYENGVGVKQDRARAFELYEQGGHLEDGASLFQLARCYAEGIGCKKDLKKVEDLCDRAAKLGYPEADQLKETVLSGN